MKKIHTLLILFPVLVVSCQSMAPTPPQSEAQQECLPPLENFSYLPQGGERDGPERDLIYPSGDWQYVTSIPGFKSSKDFPVESKSFIVQPSNDGPVVWIHGINSDLDGFHIRYHVNSNVWDKVNYDYLKPYPDLSVFLDHKNNIWMAEWVQSNIKAVSPDTPILSQYNEQGNKFKTILKISDFLNTEQIKNIERYGIAHYAIDGNGDFWFIFVKDTERWLFRYSPSSMKLERYLSDVKLDEHAYGNILAVSSDGNVFILDSLNENIIRYNPSDKTVYNKYIPSEVIKNSNLDREMWDANLFIDASNRLWIDDRGWFDLTGDRPDWHIVIRSPIFIKYQYYMWAWAHPVFSTTTKDGRLWFYADGRGTGWVDPSKAKWCLFTTLSSNVVKDDGGNLWILLDGKLYKHPAIP